MNRIDRSDWMKSGSAGVLLVALSCVLFLVDRPIAAQQTNKDQFADVIRPMLKTYCLDCHSTKAKKGSLDLERFAAIDDLRKDIKIWQNLIEQIEAGEMPPKEKPQPTAEQKKDLVKWVRRFLDAEAISRKGDPGHVPLRRLSNAEYDATIRDLTGVDLRPTREFPADGAAGEGFTNAAEALTEVSPALLTKYLNAARDLADHAVLMPEGFRFSAGKTRRDWSDEGVAKLRAFYTRFAPADGLLAIQPYLTATIRYRDALQTGKKTLEEVAIREKLHGKYLGILWKVLNDKSPSYPLDEIRAHWRNTSEKDVPAFVAEITARQKSLWQTARIGSSVRPVGSQYVENLSRQIANDPAAAELQTLKVTIKPVPGQNDVTLHLSTRDLLPTDSNARVIWQRPRFEGAGKPPLLLADYAKFGPVFEVDYTALFSNSSHYLAASVEAVNDKTRALEDVARQHNLDPAFLKRWIEVLDLKPFKNEANTVVENAGRIVPVVALELLSEKNEKAGNKPWVNGWRKKGTDLPTLVTNSTDTIEYIPGRVGAHGVSVHPMPTEFVAVTWKSPIAGRVRINAKIAHAHPACGNGVAWWLEHRRADRATMFVEGAVELGQEAKAPENVRTVEKGDLLLLAVDAKDRNHVCDLTEIAFTIAETEKPKRIWNLAADVADRIHEGNPHSDSQGNKETWSFVKGPTRTVGNKATTIPTGSALGRWREAASDPKRQDELPKLATEVQRVLAGTRPTQAKDPNRVMFDNLVSVESILLNAIDRTRIVRPQTGKSSYGSINDQLGIQVEEGNIIAPANRVIQVQLPAPLFFGREFVVEGKLHSPSGERVVRFQVLTTAPGPSMQRIDSGTVVASPTGNGFKTVLAGLNDFRQAFPLFICFPPVIPTDEAVSLKMFHREDEPLNRLFLGDADARQLEEMWKEHRFVSRQAILENHHLSQFIGFVTQDQPKAMLEYFEAQRPAFQKRADEFAKEELAAIPKQLDALLEFASRAYRRPLRANEETELQNLYRSIREKGTSHDEAFRGTLMRIFVSPAFLFRIEESPQGTEPKPVNDWELATRLSYFLWSSAPDEELRRLAAAGQLHDPKVLAAQTKRMLNDARVRSLAIEFGTQWIHVRGFDELKEKNERLFPTFNAELRKAIYEESSLFFQDLFQNDRPVTQLLDSDASYLNETLAKHYGIPGVMGPHWRRVEGVKKFGRGGVLGLASVQTKESGASRTSPILRGNWVVETLLGEKLPKPPANVPKLPEEEGGADKLTIRQQVERHTSDPTCATCHQRIDPFGFALEKYDPIGRWREKDSGGLPIDTRTKLKDGTEFDGPDGLRTYLLKKKKDVIVRLFCKRLLGYALGRSVTLSDTSLLDEMVAELSKYDGTISTAVLTIVRSPQFRMVRGREFQE
jgi:hypothetical protein